MRLLLICLCASCADTEPTCSYESEPVALDDESVLGFSAQEEQRAMVGVWTGELTYEGGADSAEVTPSMGMTRIVFEWVALGGDARHVYGTAPAGTRLACEEYLESDMELRFATDDHMFDEVFAVPVGHAGGPKRGTVIDVRDHQFAGFHAALVSPEQFDKRGSDLWLMMEADTAVGFINVWGMEPPRMNADGTTTGEGPAPKVVTFTATRR